MTTNAFEKIWEQASTRHPNGLVNETVISSCVLKLIYVWNFENGVKELDPKP